MQFEYDPEKLIEEVRIRPGIWDYEDVNYRTKETRHRLWTEVVAELLQNDVMKVTKSEKRELELQLQKKWKSIRDCFQKYCQNPNRSKKPYIYCKQLQFLLKSQSTPGNQAGSSDSEDGIRKKLKVWKSKKKLTLVKDDRSSEEDNGNDIYQEEPASYSNDEAEVSIPKKVQRINKNAMHEFAFANVDNKFEADDPDKMFLLSLLPHLKSIPEELRLNVKMDLMHVLRNANYNTLADHKII